MKLIIAIVGLGMMLSTVGCVVHDRGPRGGAYIGFYGEAPEHRVVVEHDHYYGHRPYDRDHYWEHDYRY